MVNLLPCFTLVLLCSHFSDSRYRGEADLINHILEDYNPAARPRNDALQSVSVNIGFHLARLDSTDLRNNKIMTTGWLVVEWQDEFLRWNESDFHNITKVIIPASKVWRPDLALDNSAGELYSSLYNSAFQVVIHSNGSILWEPGGSFSTICNFNIRLYPFDNQTCEIVFASWHYTLDMVNLTSSRHVKMETYLPNGEWAIENTQLFRREWMENEKPSDIYPEIAIKIQIRRKHLYYVINIIIPTFMMSLLVLMVFHLPPDSGEKVSLGVTVLLAFSVFQLMIAESVPSSSDATPMLEIYLLFFMAQSTFSVAISVIVLNLHHRTEYKHPPNWLRKLVFHWMAKLVCMKSVYSTAVDVIKETESHFKEQVVSNIDILLHKDESETIHNFQSEKVKNRQPTLVLPSINIVESKSSDIGIHDKSGFNSHSNMNLDGSNILSSHTNISAERDHLNLSPNVVKSALRVIKSIGNMDHLPRNNSKVEFMNLIKDTYKELCQQRQDDEIEQLLENEWKRIAKVVDRFFFVVTVSFMLLSSVIIFAVIPHS